MSVNIYMDDIMTINKQFVLQKNKFLCKFIII